MRGLILNVGCVFLLLMSLTGNASNVDEAKIILDQAIDAQNNGEDRSVFDRLLLAAYELDPESANINWQRLWSKHSALHGSGKIAYRAPALASVAPEIERVKALATKRGEDALAHYIQARYLNAYRQHDEALDELEKALTLQPKSSRFLYVKADILASKGKWNYESRDVWLNKANQILETMLTATLDPSAHINKHNIYFQLGYNASALKNADASKTIAYYLKSLGGMGSGVEEHFVWNNLSIAYLKLNECQQAFDAAKQALELVEFGAAKTNLRNANYCLEMQRMDIM